MPITVEYANNDDGKFSLELEELGRSIARQLWHSSGVYCDQGPRAGLIRYSQHIYLAPIQVDLIKKIRKLRYGKSHPDKEGDREQSQAETPE